MKYKNFKIITFLLALTLLLSACSNKEDIKKTGDNKSQKETTSLSNLKDGTYKKSANGYDRELTVEVEIKDNKIKDIKLLENHETTAVIERAFPIIKQRIVESNSPNVDSVSAATASSFAVKTAVLEALEDAGLKKGSIEISNSTGYEPDRKLKDGKDKETDILVIGGGPSGLAAAIEAKQKGANKVTLIEKLDILSGNGKFDMNFYDLPNSKAMKDKENEVTKEQFKEKVFGKAWDTKERQEAQTEGAFVLDNWLRDLGIELEYNYGGKGAMNHMRSEKEYAGNHIQTKLEENAKKLGIEILTGTKGTDLIIENGEAKGANVEDKSTRYKINAKATIIATGGFSNNKELLKEYAPGSENIPTSNQMGTTGDFVKIAKKHNIKLDHMGNLSIFPKILDPRRDLTGHSGNNFVYLNSKGERFIDETIRNNVVAANKLMENKPVYFVLDQEGLNSFFRTRSHYEKGYYKKANNIEDLAKLINANAETLKSTLETFNKAVDGEIKDPFRKKAASKKLDLNGPLYFAKITQGIHMTKGGIVANEKAEVLNNSNEIIKGLFAAGEVTDISGGYSASVVFGRISGDSAVKFIKK